MNNTAGRQPLILIICLVLQLEMNNYDTACRNINIVIECMYRERERVREVSGVKSKDEERRGEVKRELKTVRDTGEPRR